MKLKRLKNTTRKLGAVGRVSVSSLASVPHRRTYKLAVKERARHLLLRLLLEHKPIPPSITKIGVNESSALLNPRATINGFRF